jgi:hypothetical protein
MNKIQNLEQFLTARGLNYKVVVGPRHASEDADGKPSEDRFYIINSSLETVKSVRSVWKKGEWSSYVTKAIEAFDLHETKMTYSHDLKAAKQTILAEGEKAYNAYVIRQQRIDKNTKADKVSKEFSKIIKETKK